MLAYDHVKIQNLHGSFGILAIIKALTRVSVEGPSPVFNFLVFLFNYLLLYQQHMVWIVPLSVKFPQLSYILC